MMPPTDGRCIPSSGIMKLVAATILDSTHLELREALSARPGESIQIVIPDAVAETDRDRPQQSAGHRRLEQEWRRAHKDVLLDYAGRWVVLEGEKIIVHGDDPVKLVEMAREAGVEVPYVFYVDPPRAGIVKIGL